MYHVVFAQIIHAERERELEEAIRRRLLLKPPDEAVEVTEAADRRQHERPLTSRARHTVTP